MCGCGCRWVCVGMGGYGCGCRWCGWVGWKIHEAAALDQWHASLLCNRILWCLAGGWDYTCDDATFVLNHTVIPSQEVGLLDCQSVNHWLLGSYHEISCLPRVVTPIRTILKDKTGVKMQSRGQGMFSVLVKWSRRNFYHNKALKLRFKTSWTVWAVTSTHQLQEQCTIE